MTAKSVINTKANNLDYVPSAGVTVKKPTHNITLTDAGGTTAGLILCNRNGLRDNRSSQQGSMPRTALQTSQASAGYDDMELPFVAEVQSTMSGGRGQDNFSSDRTKFFDSYRLDTTKEYPVCGPWVVAQTGIASTSDLTPWSTVQQQHTATPATNRAYACKYPASSTISVQGLTLNIGSLFKDTMIYYSFVAGSSLPAYSGYDTVEEYQYSANAPDISLGMVDIYLPVSPTTVTAGQNLYFMFKTTRPCVVPIGYPVAGAKTYHANDADNDWALYTEDSGDGSGWAVNFKIHTTVEVETKLFEYKRQLYAILNTTKRDTANLYMNGWRGVADANASLSVLADSTQTGWANNTAADCIVLIINGPGETEKQPWRRVVSSTSGVLNLASPWKIAPTTATEYVVLGSNRWTPISTMPASVDYFKYAVTSLAVVDDYVVFAFGDVAGDSYLTYYKVDNDTDHFRQQWAIDTAYKADLLCPIVNEEGSLKLWRADCDDCWIDCSDVPPWGSPPAFLFDINAHARADLVLVQQRTKINWDLENAKQDKDSGLLETYERAILDTDYQITANKTTVNQTDEPAGTGPSLAGTTYVTTAPSISHKYLPSKVYCGNTSARITNLIGYGSPAIPYVLKEDGFGSVSDGIYSELPIGEMRSVRSEVNGISAMQYGVYLYFNLAGNMLERYYDQRLDDIGLNRDEGLPPTRQGEIVKLIPYTGRYYAAVDAGFFGYSSIMCNNLLGWHEIYRSGVLGERIWDIIVQTIPGTNYVDRLVVAQGGDIVVLPISTNPTQQVNYPYLGYKNPTASGYVDTSWIDFDFKDVTKYFHSITIHSDYTGTVKTGNEYQIEVWFRTESDNDWVYGGKAMASEPSDATTFPAGGRSVGVKEIPLWYPTHPNKLPVSGKKIKFRVRMTPLYSRYETPRLKALVVNGVMRMPVKRSWNVTFQLEPMKDLQDRHLVDDQGILYSQLYRWANSKLHSTPLTMRSNDELMDNKRVFIDPPTISTFSAVTTMGDKGTAKDYLHVATVTIYEV